MNRAAAAGLVMVCAVFAVGLAAAGEETIKLQDAPGRELVAAHCATCHSLDYIQMNAAVLDRAGWQKSLHKMIDQFGAPIAGDDAGRILDYLAENY